MTHFQAVYYRTADEREPVREFIASLDDEARAAINREVGRLNLLDDRIPHLPFPHSSQIEGELRELRCHYGRNLYRVLYRRSDRLLVMVAPGLSFPESSPPCSSCPCGCDAPARSGPPPSAPACVSPCGHDAPKRPDCNTGRGRPAPKQQGGTPR